MTHLDLNLSWTVPGPGETLAAHYVVEGERGRGGLAVVLSALQIKPNRPVVIKMLLPEWAGDRDIVERFVREGRAAARVTSEHAVRVLDVQISDRGAPYLVLERLTGHSLDEIVRTWGPLPVATSIDWLLQAAEAIAEAHAQGIVHHNLKPSNLFLTQRSDGTACVKVADFGLSKITDPRLEPPFEPPGEAAGVAGSPHCMAPEQLHPIRRADSRADLWALGVVLYELLTGKPPFAGGTFPELRATVLTAPAPPLSAARGNVPPAVEQAVLRCLQKDPDARFASIAEMARALSPYGTRLGRTSLERIERTLGSTGGLSDFSLPPLPDSEAQSWPGADDGRAFQTPASARVVVGSFVMLSGLFIGAFMWIYADVHAGEGPSVGTTSMQPAHAAAAYLAAPPVLPAATAPAKADVPPAAMPPRPPARMDGRRGTAASPVGGQSTDSRAKSAPPTRPAQHAPAARRRLTGSTTEGGRTVGRSAPSPPAARAVVRATTSLRPAPSGSPIRGSRAAAARPAAAYAAGGSALPEAPAAMENPTGDDNPYASPAHSPPARPAAPYGNDSTESPPAAQPATPYGNDSTEGPPAAGDRPFDDPSENPTP